MIVSFGTYCRVETAAGGVTASRLAILKAARRIIQPCHRRTREKREARHAFYRGILAHHDNAIAVYRECTR